MYKVRNKWNGKDYFVVTNDNAKAVTLKREDGTTFTIQKSELLFSYYINNFEKIEHEQGGLNGDDNKAKRVQ